MKYTTQLSDLQKSHLEEATMSFESKQYISENGGNISAPLQVFLDSWENFKAINPIFNTSNYEGHPLYMDYMVALFYSGGKHTDFLRPCFKKNKTGVNKTSAKSGKTYRNNLSFAK